MKKALFFPMAIAIVALASCAKQESEILETPQGKTHVIHAVIDDQDPASKTAYTDAGVFSWVKNDAMKVVVYKADDTKIVDKYTYKAASSGVKVDFTPSGTPDYTAYPQSGFAVYPDDIQTGGAKDAYVLALPAEYTVSGSDFSAVGVPLIGTAKTEDSYSFKTAVGVLKVTFSDVPSSARKVVLTSASDNLSGVCYLDASTAANGLRMADDFVSSIGHSITVNFPAQASGSTINVYIPVPVGTISAGATLSVQMADGTPIKTTPATTQPITITRGHLTPISVPVTVANWESLGNGKFIDTYVWNDKGWGSTPVEVEFFSNTVDPNAFRMANPYAAAAAANSVATTEPDEFFYFTKGEKGRIQYEWVNMGFGLSKNAAKNWAMIDGYSVAGYGNGYARSHVVSYATDGTINNIQLAPCYRISDENKTGAPSTYDNEIGKDGQNGIIEIAFPGKDILMPYTISAISVSSNQSGDGGGAAALKDDNLTTFWHSPYSPASTTFDAVYGEYVQVKLEEGVSKFAFNYCTRDHSNQGPSPALVVIGGSKNGQDWTIIETVTCVTSDASNTWVGLPILDGSEYAYLRMGVAMTKEGSDLRTITAGSQHTNLAEVKLFAVTTGNPAPWEPVLEPNQVWVKSSQITVNSDCSKYDGTDIYDGNGYASLVDLETSTFWHSSWKTTEGYYNTNTDYNATYGITIDIELASPLKDFHLSYYVRSGNNNGEPRAIKFAGSNDGTSWTPITTIEDDALMKVAAGTRVDLSAINATESYSHLRIGIIKAGNGDTPSDLRLGGGFTALAEILLFAD